MTVEQLLEESLADAEERERTSFDGQYQSRNGALVLFGAGNLGRKTLSALRCRGVEPVAFADNDTGLHGTRVDGLLVYSLSEAAERWGSSALFIITIFSPFADHGARSRRQSLADLDCRNVISFLPVAWRFPGILPHYGAMLPSQLMRQVDALRTVYSLLQDDESRETFREQLTWRLRGSFAEVQAPAADQYFVRDLIVPNPEEILIDGGAFDGDTVRQIPWPFSYVLSVEPDPLSFERLVQSAIPRVEPMQAALGNVAGKVKFGALGTPASARSTAGLIEVPVKRIDDLPLPRHPTFLKLDVEGDELSALQGARQTLADTKPVTAVCVYHRPEDFWTIPLFLNEVMPTNRLFLRSHAYDGFELVVYSVPRARCLK